VASTKNIDSTSTPIGRADSRTRRFQEVEELKSKIEEVEELKKSKIEEVEELKNSKIEEVKRLKKLKIEEVEDLKFGDSTRVSTRIESRGLLTRVCPSGTRGLVYRAWPIKEVDKYKDLKIDLE
jgi:hypothetical protein